MASDNKVSSFFLLILIGLVIYYLLNCEGFGSPSNLKEKFETDLATENVDNEEVSEEVVNEEVSEENANNEQSEIKYEFSQEPYVPQSVINDIAVGQQSVNNVTPEKGAGIYTFQPNDESELDVYGTSLNDAFALPIPNGTQTDTVDFKKQNVDNYNAKDFLPREVNDEWFETDFSLAKYQLNDDKLINTEKYIIGINTVGQSLKNATWDIRGTIPNPKLVVSPWMNSTYEPDFNLKPLC
jgi:hypothetical protein